MGMWEEVEMDTEVEMEAEVEIPDVEMERE